MGENLELVRPARRRAAANVDAFLGEDSGVLSPKQVFEGQTTLQKPDRESEAVSSQTELVNKEEQMVVKKSSFTFEKKSLQLPLENGSSLDQTRPVDDGKSARRSRPVLLSGLSRQSSSSKSPESALRVSQGSVQSKSRGSHFSCDPPSQTKRFRSPSKIRSFQTNNNQGESSGNVSKSGSQMSTSPKSAKVRNRREYDLASQIFTQSSSCASGSQKSPTQRSPTQRSPTQRSSTQRSPTQRSSTQRSSTQRSPTQRSPTQRSSTQRSSYSQLSQLSGFSTPRQQLHGALNLPRAELTQAAGHIMGSLARSIMEGSASMVKDFLEAAGGNAPGHDKAGS